MFSFEGTPAVENRAESDVNPADPAVPAEPAEPGVKRKREMDQPGSSSTTALASIKGRYYGYISTDSNKGTVLTFWPLIIDDDQQVWIKYYKKLDKIHEVTDTRHDQQDTVRGSSRLLTDAGYRAYLQENILKKAGFIPTTYEFETCSGDETREKYNLNTDSIHKLFKSLLRKHGHELFQIDGFQIVLPKYVVVESDNLQSTLPDNEYANCQVEISKYDGTTRIDEFVRVTNGKNNTFKFVNDCGSSDLYNKFVQNPNAHFTSTSVFSGIMDSSSSNHRENERKEHFQVFIPFMYVSEEESVWLYCCPNESLTAIDAYFSKPITIGTARAIYQAINGANIEPNKTYISSLKYLQQEDVFKHVNITNIPTLPEISIYIASEGYNQRKKCIDLFIKTDRSAVELKCQPFFECAKFIFTIDDNITTEQKSLIDRFFMQIKHFGDRFRVIDSVVLSHDDDSRAITGTCDSFLKNLFIQAEMYGVYANKGTNLVLSNIRDQPSQEVIIGRLKKTILQTYREYTAMKTYVVSKMTELQQKDKF